jgi:hypothetical protein
MKADEIPPWVTQVVERVYTDDSRERERLRWIQGLVNDAIESRLRRLRNVDDVIPGTHVTWDEVAALEREYGVR